MRKFDYSFIKNNIPGNIVGLTDVIVDLRRKEEFRKLQYKDTFESLRKKAIIESVKGSNLNKLIKENKITKIGTYKDARYKRA